MMTSYVDQDKTIVNDTIHGIITLPTHILDIIDTPQFQRLRFVSQLGFTNYVYPTALHSRFEHSIGTFHLASRLIKQLQNQLKLEPIQLSDTENLEISEDEVICVEIAALCHDLGHGPFSHTWENVVIPMLEITNYKHEERSCEIFEDLLENNKNGETIKERILLDKSKKKSEKDKALEIEFKIDLIKRIILGKYDKERDCQRKFLFEIVANKESGLDVDKFDYLCRDQMNLGWSNTNQIHDINRILHFMRVTTFENKETKDKNKNEYRLAIRDREIFHLHHIFYLRHMLHRYGCIHKTVKAMECMFEDAMRKLINNYPDQLYNSVMEEERACIDKSQFGSKEFISKCSDRHIWTAMSTYTRDIVKDIEERKIYKLYDKFQIELTNDNVEDGGHQETKKCALERVKKMAKEIFNSEVERGFVSFNISKFEMQSESNGNPLLKIPFYEKRSKNKSSLLREEDLSPFVQLVSDECVLMILTKESVKKNSNIDKTLRLLVRQLESKVARRDYKIRMKLKKLKY